MFVVARAATYSALFVGLLLIFVPEQILERASTTARTSTDQQGSHCAAIRRSSRQRYSTVSVIPSELSRYAW
jgi:hypothetical protein